MDDLAPNTSFQFILKPSLACNLACEYCYAARMHGDARARMTLAEARIAVAWALRFCLRFGIRKVSFLWQGGEPLMAGAPFIEEIASSYEEDFARQGIECSSLLQTNLLLMDDEMVEVVKRHFRGQVGFSYDFNSSTRVYADGRNAAADILEKAKWCKSQGLSIGAICQITGENIGHLGELYAMFKELGIHFKISQVFPSQDGASANAMAIAPEASARAICELFDLWFFDKEAKIEISNLKELVAALLRGESTECCRQPNCASLLLSLIPGGRILPCARFSGEEDVVGDYYKDVPAAVMAKRTSHQNSRTISDDACDACRYKAICNGGCYYNRITGWHDGECISNRIILAHIEARLNEHGLQFGCMKRKEKVD